MADVKPPRADSKYDWEAICAQLRETPTEWVMVAEQAPRSLYSAIRRQRVVAVRDREWVYEACSRKTHGSKADLWMMARPREEDEMDTWDSRL